MKKPKYRNKKNISTRNSNRNNPPASGNLKYTKEHQSKSSARLSTKSTFSILTGLIGVIAFLLTIWPKVKISPLDISYPNDPFSVRFKLENNGELLSIYDVRITAILTGRLGEGKWNNIITDTSPEIINELKPGRGSSQWLKMVIPISPSQTAEFEVKIKVQYAWPFRCWWQHTHEQRFVTIRGQSGSFKWVEQSVE